MAGLAGADRRERLAARRRSRSPSARRRRGLPPVVGERPEILIVGSLPGEASLRAREYYAHPRNQFWAILGDLVGASRQLAYERRLARLAAARIALWDVARTCRREASSDATMRDVVANDFVRLFRASPTLERVLCNGAKAHAMFVRLVLPRLVRAGVTPGVIRLPSTSPAHASLGLADKLTRWRAALLLDPDRRLARVGRADAEQVGSGIEHEDLLP